MNPIYEKLQKCFAAMRKKAEFGPKVALVLGSGLGAYGSHIEVADIIEYKEIEGFPVSTVSGHAGRFIFGYVGKVPVVCMQGRIHYYEGYEMSDVVLPIRLMKMMGADTLLLTNASGGIRQGFRGGDLMLITGQIASFVPSPLRGPNIEELGVRFPDMGQIYDLDLQRTAKRAAMKFDIDLKEGIYVQLPGPQYESPQEIAMCRTLGADAVGMSTACEAIAARHMQMRVLGISCITNMASGITPFTLSHEEVKRTANRIAEQFESLVTEIILTIKPERFV